MSDKLTQDFDIFYLELNGTTAKFKRAKDEITTDPHLSRAGKNASLAELQKEHEKALAELGKRFNSDFGKRVQDIEEFNSGKKKNVVLDSIKSKLSKGEDLSTEQQNRLIIHELSENKKLMAKSSFQNMLANADTEQLRKTAQTLSNSQDVERLEWLQELVSIRGDTAFSNAIQAQRDAAKTSTLSDEQKNLQTVSARIQKGLQLFAYSIEKSKTGEFLDVRSEEIIDNE